MGVSSDGGDDPGVAVVCIGVVALGGDADDALDIPTLGCPRQQLVFLTLH